MQSDPPTGDPRVALDAIRRLVRDLRESSRAAEKQVKIGGAQLFVLGVLAREGPLSQGELAARTMTHQSSVSGVVARLVQRGLVASRRSSTDGRRLELHASARGLAVLKGAPATAQERMIDAMRRLPPARLRQLNAGLAALIAEMGLAGTPAPMFFHESEKGK
jgi:DNA-binding MarR family transcriptional regulator